MVSVYNEEIIKLHQLGGEIPMPKEVASYQLQEVVDETLRMKLEN